MDRLFVVHVSDSTPGHWTDIVAGYYNAHAYSITDLKRGVEGKFFWFYLSSFQLAQKVQTFVNPLNNVIHMVIPLEITRQGTPRIFAFFTHAMFLILTVIGSKSLWDRANIMHSSLHLSSLSWNLPADTC